MVGAWSVSSIMAVFISTQDRLLGSGKVPCHLDPSPQLFGKGTVPQVVLQVTGGSLLCSFVNTCELWNAVRYFVIDEKRRCLTEHSSIVVKRFYTSNLVGLQVKEKKIIKTENFRTNGNGQRHNRRRHWWLLPRISWLFAFIISLFKEAVRWTVDRCV